MDLGFRRHTATKKINKKRATQRYSGCPRPLVFSVDQEYSLMGCSPAEPLSTYPDGTNINTTYIYTQNSYQRVLVFR